MTISRQIMWTYLHIREMIWSSVPIGGYQRGWKQGGREEATAGLQQGEIKQPAPFMTPV
jgi:hypothetical protein